MTTDSEYRMIEQLKAGQCSVERALLMVSVLDEDGIANYQGKLDRIQREFELRYKEQVMGFNKDTAYTQAAFLFDYLWKLKPKRENKESLLANVIDNQLNGEEKIGNCLGLTSLYDVLGARINLRLSVLFNPLHVLSLLDYDGSKVAIETTRPAGFDYKIKPLYQSEDSNILVAFAFNNRGNMKEQEFADQEGAIQDYNKALEIKQDLALVLKNRGIARRNLGDYEAALHDSEKALEIDPHLDLTLFNKRLLSRLRAD